MVNLIDKFIGAVRGFASDVSGKINDTQGLFQQGKFTPIKAAQQSISNWATKNPTQATKIIQAPVQIKTKISPIVNQFKINVMKDWASIKTGKVDFNKINSQPSFAQTLIDQGIKNKIIPTKTYQSGKVKAQGIDYEKILNKGVNLGLSAIPGVSATMSLYKQGTEPLDVLKAEDKFVSDSLGKVNSNLPTVYNAAKYFVPGYFEYQIAKEVANAPGNINAIMNDTSLNTGQKAGKILLQEVTPLLAYKYAPEIAKTVIPEPTYKAINSILGPVFIKTPGLMNLFIRAATRGGSQVMMLNTALAIRQGLQENKDLRAIVANLIQTAPSTFAGGALFGVAAEGINTMTGGRSAAADINKVRAKTINDTMDYINQSRSKLATIPNAPLNMETGMTPQLAPPTQPMQTPVTENIIPNEITPSIQSYVPPTPAEMNQALTMSRGYGLKETPTTTVIDPKAQKQIDQLNTIKNEIISEISKADDLIAQYKLQKQADPTLMSKEDIKQAKKDAEISVKQIDSQIGELQKQTIQQPVIPTIPTNEELAMKALNASRGITPEDIAVRTAYENTVKNGGVTINLKGIQPTEGYAYAPSKNTEVKIDEAKFSIKDIENFKAKNAELLKDPNNHLGFWKENGIIYMDVSRVGPPTTETIAAAKAADQLAVFDLKEFKTIYTKDYETTNSPNIGGEQNLGTVVPGNTGGSQEIQRSGTEKQAVAPATSQEIINPFNLTSVEKVPSPGKKERGLITSIKEDESVLPEIKTNLQSEYSQTTDLGRKEYGQEYIKKDYSKALSRALSTEKNTPEIDGIRLALWEDLQKNARTAREEGNQEQFDKLVNLADQVAEKAAESLTGGAQSVQFAQNWTGKTPDAMINWTNQIFDQANKFKNISLSSLFKFKISNDLKMTPALEEKIKKRIKEINLLDGEEKDQAIVNLQEEITKDIPTPIKTWIDAIRYDGVLSGFSTMLKNFYWDTIIPVVVRPVEMLDRSGWDLIKQITTGKKAEYKFSDIPKYYVQLFGGVKEATEMFKNSFMTPYVSFGKYDNPYRTPFEDMMMRRMPYWLTTSARVLIGTDNAFTSLLVNAESARLRSLGIDEATIKQTATDMAKELLLMSRPDPSGKQGQGHLLQWFDKLAKWIGQVRKWPFGDWFAMFIQVPINASKMYIKFDPVLGPLTAIGAKNKAEAFSRARVASMVALLGTIFAASGLVDTGNPPNTEKGRKLHYDTGRGTGPRFFVPTINRWIPAGYLGPFASAFFLPAQIKEAFFDGKTALSDNAFEKLGKLVTMKLNLISETTPLNGIMGLLKTISGDIDYTWAKNIGWTASQIIPKRAIIQDIAELHDNILRKSKGIKEEFMKVIPGIRQQLEPYTDTFGEPVDIGRINSILPWSLGEGDAELEKIYKEYKVEQQQKSYNQDLIKEVENEKSSLPKTSIGLPKIGDTSEKKKQIDDLLKGYDEADSEELKQKFKQAIEKYGVNFNDVYENYLTKDTKISQKGLSPGAARTLERSNEFTYIRKLRNQFDGTGIGGDYLGKEMERKGITAADLEYDDKTALPDDVQIEEIKNSIASLSGNTLIETLISYRRISEGTRKALLTDTLITKLNKEGIINDALAEMLKSVGWDTKTGQFKTIPGTGKKTNFSKFTVPGFKSISTKKITIPKIKLPDLKSSGTSSAYTKIATKMPRVKTNIYKSGVKLIKTKIRKPVTRIKNLGGIA